MLLKIGEFWKTFSAISTEGGGQIIPTTLLDVPPPLRIFRSSYGPAYTTNSMRLINPVLINFTLSILPKYEYVIVYFVSSELFASVIPIPK